MYDMMLGPCGATYWKGSGGVHPLPRSRFHMDWSRVAFVAAAFNDELHAFSYAIGDQQPAAITAAIGATQADIFDTSIVRADSLSKTCLATHLGVTMDRVTLIAGGADIVSTLAATRVAMPRIMIRFFWAERTNEEVVGNLEDFAEGIGMDIVDYTNAVAWGAQYNGVNMLSNVKPLPRPCPCKGGETYVRVTFHGSIRDAGVNFATIQGFTSRIYGVAPAKVQPGEAPKKAMQALGLLGA